LLDTNERLEKHNDPRNSFKTKAPISTRYKLPFLLDTKWLSSTLAPCAAPSFTTDHLDAVSVRELSTFNSTVNYNVTNASRSSRTCLARSRVTNHESRIMAFLIANFQAVPASRIKIHQPRISGVLIVTTGDLKSPKTQQNRCFQPL
jgi:hypothetical protein